MKNRSIQEESDNKDRSNNDIEVGFVGDSE